MLDYLNNFIIWCNENQGFVSALLAAAALSLSVIAVIVSVRTARLAFKKKIAVCYYTNIKLGPQKGIDSFSVEATNIGNRAVRVTFIGVGVKKHGKWQKAYDTNKPDRSNVRLDKGESACAEYDAEFIKTLNKKAYAIAVDAEGKVYKRKIR